MAPLSQAQQGFLAGDRQQQASSPMATPAEKAIAREEKAAGRLDEAKAFSLQRAGEPARVAGVANLAAERLRQEGRSALAQQKGQIRADIEQSKSGSREKVAALNNALKQAEGERDRAQRTGDTDAKLEADRDIANLKGTQRMAELKLTNQFDLQSETNSFIKAAELQAQREGTDVKLAILKLAADPFVDEDIRNAIIAQGVDNLISAPEPVATATPTAEVADVTQTVATPQGAGQATVGVTDADGDGQPETQAQVDSARAVVERFPTREDAAKAMSPTQLIQYDRAVAIAKAFQQKLNKEATDIVGRL
jgi:hypothetical protein